MTIVVEDGSNVANSNSYVSLEEFGDYAVQRGITLPATPEEQEVLLIKAMDYLELQDSSFMGVRMYDDQELSWPRIYDYRDYLVPDNLKKAQMVLAVLAMTMDLLPASAAATASATRKTVGPLTVEYASQASDRPRIPQVDALLLPLYGGGGLSGQLRVIRA